MGNVTKILTFHFKWVEDTMKKEEGYILEVDVQYREKLYEIHSDLQFLPEREKLKKVEKLVTNLHDKTEYVNKKFKTSTKSQINFEKSSQSD